MARPFKLEFFEDVEYLEQSLRQTRLGSQKEKLQTLWWLQRQFQGVHLAQLRQRLQVECQRLTAEQVDSLTSYDFRLEALFYAAS